MKTMIILLILLLTICSCPKKEQKVCADNNLELMKSKYPYINVNSLEFTKLMPMYEDTFYLYEGMNSDTLYYLSFYKNKEIIFIDNYMKEYKDTEFLYKLLMKSDTIYFFKENTITGKKDFFVGEYGYKYHNGYLNADEINYYMLYKDSLNQIKGNSLPKLPKLTNEEMELLKRKYDPARRNINN